MICSALQQLADEYGVEKHRGLSLVSPISLLGSSTHCLELGFILRAELGITFGNQVHIVVNNLVVQPLTVV